MTLDLSYNKLSTIDNDAFATNRNLVKINFGSNSLQVLNPEIFTPTKVSHLNLYSNIGMVFEARKYLATKELTTLGLKGAGFKEITAKMLSNLPNLDELDMSENSIGIIEPGAFETNNKLTELRLNDNNLKVFDPKLIEKLKNLIVLCVDRNNFTRDSRNVRLQKLFIERKYRNTCFSVVDDKQRFENLPLMPWPKNNTEETSTASIENIGISDAFISSYIVLIVIIQTVALVVLIWYLIILTKPGDSKDQIDYSSTILNDSDIYAIDRRQS
jgi:Leucine-rich repeat (LRR) protein